MLDGKGLRFPAGDQRPVRSVGHVEPLCKHSFVAIHIHSRWLWSSYGGDFQKVMNVAQEILGFPYALLFVS